MTLAIIQARIHSNRLKRKMLLKVNGEPVIWWAYEATCKVFGGDEDDVYVACPAQDADAFRMHGIPSFGWEGNEDDVLGRFHACAHRFRSDPETIIARITPDDWPIDPFRERCTLAQLDEWHATVTDPRLREHIGLLFPKRIELNTQADYEAICQIGPMGLP